MSEKNIMLYGLSSCSHCKSVRNMLLESKVKFDWVNVDMLVGDERNDTMRRVKKLNPRVSFPTLVVGDEVIVGFKQDKIREALSKHQRESGGSQAS